MKTVMVSISLMLFLLNALSVYAQDYGTHLTIKLDESVNRSFWRTDWSPDGKWIAFGVADGYDIYVCNLQNMEVKNVTEQIEEMCSWPCFTPDSKEISFSRMIFDDEKDFLDCTVEAVNIYTSEHRLVFENAYAGSWSYDGDFFISIYYPPDQNRNYALYDYDSEETTYYNYWTLEPPSFRYYPARMSPDNTYLILPLKAHNERKHPVNLLYRVDIYSGETIQMDLVGGDIEYAEYSPDGKWITFSGQMYTSSGDFLYDDAGVYSTETGEVFELVSGSEYEVHFSCWSHDGTQICYVLEKDNGHELYIKDFEFASSPTPVYFIAEIPEDIIIHGNYPNPFNPSTTIEFSIPESGLVDLVIYNVMGQKVRTLISEQLNQGIHTVVWDGCDEHGLPVSAGIYFTYLMMGNAMATGSMMLLK